MNISETCRTRHVHVVHVTFTDEEAPRIPNRWASDRPIAILSVDFDCHENTGALIEHAYVRAANYVKSNGQVGKQNASVGRVRLDVFPEELIAAVRAKGLEMAHEVTV